MFLLDYIMLQKIKNFFSFFKKKNILLLFGFAVSALSFFPLSAAAGIAESIVLGLPVGIIWLTIKLSVLMLDLGSVILKWVTGPNFTQLPFTRPGSLAEGGNPIIASGLTITQGFVNMILVLILVYIALATILRLSTRETNKLLVTFIVVALLVNFAPVLCGLIVDASNIVMNFFISGITGDVSTASLETMSNDQASIMIDNLTGGEALIPSIMTGVLLSGVNFFMFFIFLLFSIIFLLRYIMIWFLVILSPLAFVAYILPSTRKYWTMWWNQFIQWSIIGAVCGFFLYLGISVLTKSQEIFNGPISGATGASVLVYFVPPLFMAVGLIFGLKTTAMGASAAINLSTRAGRRVVKGTGKGGKWLGGKIAQRGIRPLATKVRLKEGAGWISRGLEKAPVARWFLSEKLRKYGQMRPAMDKAKERAKDYSSQTLAHRILKGADIQTDAVGNIAALMERGDSDDLFKEARKLKEYKNPLFAKYAAEKGKKVASLSNKEKDEALSSRRILESKMFRRRMTRPLQIAKRAGVLGSGFFRSDPRLANLVSKDNLYENYAEKIGKVVKELSRDEKKLALGDANREATKRKSVVGAVKDARAQHIQRWEREVALDPVVAEAMAANWEQSRFNSLTTVKRGQEAWHTGLDTAFSQWVDKEGEALPGDLSTQVKTVKSLTKAIEGEKAKEKPSSKEIEKHEKNMSEPLEALREEYKKYLEKTYKNTGYHKALENERFTQAGFRDAQYTTKSEPPATTMGSATLGLKPSAEPPPSGRPEGSGKGPSGRRAGGGTKPSGRKPGGEKK